MTKLPRKKLDPAPPRLRDWHVRQVYHVYQRGSRRQRVFHSRAQLIGYLNQFDRLARRLRVRVHAFCLMSNHVHFLLEPLTKWGISRLMQHLQSHYARKVHQAKGLTGHLWRHHFHAKPIQSPAQYRATLLYIEQNPTAANLVKKAHRYDYSSAPAHATQQTHHRLKHHHHRCEVRLYLARWRKEFPDHKNWAAWLRSPRDAGHQAELKEIERILGTDRVQKTPTFPLPQPQPPTAEAATAAPTPANSS